MCSYYTCVNAVATLVNLRKDLDVIKRAAKSPHELFPDNDHFRPMLPLTIHNVLIKTRYLAMLHECGGTPVTMLRHWEGVLAML